jgi:diadenosine tetraphosphatase ApaH/serine/threonine PP2A family protein phosphatase
MLIAVLSDIHSNLRALDAVIASIGSVDAVWHLGDVVGYGPEPDEVVGRLREIGAVGVKGNHDDAVCGGLSMEDFNDDARAADLWTRGRIDAGTLAYLEALPVTMRPDGGPAAAEPVAVPVAAADFTLVHGSPRGPEWEYLVDGIAARENLDYFDTRFCLVGHTHRPLVLRERRGHMQALVPDPESHVDLGDQRAFLNPGSVGQPRDGDPRASYLVLDTSVGRATWHRVAYDVAATQAQILAAGLPPYLARRLSSGH